MKIIDKNLPTKLNESDVKLFYSDLGLEAELQYPANWNTPEGVVRGFVSIDGQVTPGESPRIVVYGNVDGNIPLPPDSEKTDEEIKVEVQEKIEQEFEDKVVAVLVKKGLIQK